MCTFVFFRRVENSLNKKKLDEYYELVPGSLGEF